VIGYIVRRIVAGILVLFATSIAIFALFFYGPSDPAQASCPETKCTAARLDQIRENLGLDQPVVQQYGTYVKGIFVGRDIASGALSYDCHAPCLGVSFKQGLPVTPYLLDRFPATLSIALGAAVVFLTVGVATGIYAARRRGKTSDKVVVGLSLVVNAIPPYLLFLMSYLYLISATQILPESGYVSPFSGGLHVVAWASGMLAAWLTLGLSQATAYARFSRGSMVEVLNEDYVRTARAKGLSDRRVTFKHGLRAALVPVVTIFGLDFAFLLSGTIFAEWIFGIEGIGITALRATRDADLPLISATVLIAATFIVAANIVVDIVYSLLDPRVRLA